MGGYAVEDSLAKVGYEVPGQVSLVETQVRVRPARAVVVQSAWNVIPDVEFHKLLAPYPPKMRKRAKARRVLARYELSRARRVIALTSAMAELTSEYLGRDVGVCPVTVPLAFLEVADVREDPSHSGAGRPFALVPGSITWYKRPEVAVDWMTRLPGLVDVDLVFCGAEDRSGAWEQVRAKASQRGVGVRRTSASVSELVLLMRRAEVVFLPSGLESLGFSMGESLLVAKRVVASSIPPHKEVARRLNLQPNWEESDGVVTDLPQSPRLGSGLRAEINRQWRDFAIALDRVL